MDEYLEGKKERRGCKVGEEPCEWGIEEMEEEASEGRQDEMGKGIGMEEEEEASEGRQKEIDEGMGMEEEGGNR